MKAKQFEGKWVMRELEGKRIEPFIETKGGVSVRIFAHIPEFFEGASVEFDMSPNEQILTIRLDRATDKQRRQRRLVSKFVCGND